MTDIYISYEWRIVLCAIFMLHIRLLYRTTAEKVKGVHRMRVEQQSQNIIDVVKQSIGPEEKSGAVLSQYTTGAAGAAVEKSSVSDNAKSVNLKDATYAKPAAEDKQTVAEEIEASATPKRARTRWRFCTTLPPRKIIRKCRKTDFHWTIRRPIRL